MHYLALQVVKERAYSIAWHPSPHKLVLIAGDKVGHVGIWCPPSDLPLSPSESSSSSSGVKRGRLGAAQDGISSSAAYAIDEGNYMFRLHLGAVPRIQFAPGELAAALHVAICV